MYIIIYIINIDIYICIYVCKIKVLSMIRENKRKYGPKAKEIGSKQQQMHKI